MGRALLDDLVANPSELALRKQEAILRAEILVQTHSLDFILQHRTLLVKEWQRVTKSMDLNAAATDLLIRDAPPAVTTDLPQESEGDEDEDELEEEEEIEVIMDADDTTA